MSRSKTITNSSASSAGSLQNANAARHKLPLWICLGLSLSIVVAYHAVFSHGFVNFDDPEYITNNRWVNQGLSWSGITWAFKESHSSNWHPLTWISHMLDVSLFSLKPGGHHAVNLLFHIVNSILLFSLLRRLTGTIWRSAMVAALFALHPLHVESVAWISERKDVLSTCFGLLCLMAYSAYAKSNVEGRTSKAAYLLTFTFLALGLMSKPMLVTWPLVMLLLDLWPLRRIDLSTFDFRLLKSLCLEKVPFFALILCSSVVTFLVQKGGGSVADLNAIGLLPRIQNALWSYVGYLQNTFWPVDLAAYYPLPKSPSEIKTALAILILAFVSWFVFKQRRERPYLIVGWLWYLTMLVPVIGIVQVGFQAMADRYTYVPLTGIFILLVWGFEEMTRTWQHRRLVVIAVPLAVLIPCLILTSVQASYWKDSETLHRHTLAVTTQNTKGHLNLGTALVAQGRMQEASEQFSAALAINPEYAEARSNLGFTLGALGRYAEAIVQYQLALQTKPHAKTYFLLGNALNAQGKTAEAIAAYRRALELDPDQAGALNDLAWILATSPDAQFRNGNEAVRLGERACQVTVQSEPMFLGTLAAAYAEAGRFADAVRVGEQAHDLANRGGLKELATRNAELVTRYRAGKPYRDQVAPPSE